MDAGDRVVVQVNARQHGRVDAMIQLEAREAGCPAGREEIVKMREAFDAPHG